jgi:hypothetical protein
LSYEAEPQFESRNNTRHYNTYVHEPEPEFISTFGMHRGSGLRKSKADDDELSQRISALKA